KQTGKLALDDQCVESPEARAVLFYLAAVAAALTHHGLLISSRDPETLALILTDLAGLSPPPVRDVIQRAIPMLQRRP
ncbi:MAG: hypothetical protein K8E66_08290, partial [Phycisphaerales bacterium]|nr:hypothetical protein [Phycisphaerales bacterium]